MHTTTTACFSFSPMAGTLQFLIFFSVFTLLQANTTPEITVTTTNTTLRSPPLNFSNTALLDVILSHLGFNELAMAAPSLSATYWSVPSTLFAPSDSSLRTCLSCSVPDLLREHIVPGVYTIDIIRKLPSASKIETLTPGRCLIVNKISFNDANDSVAVKVFIGGREILNPDMFNNGEIVVHGIRGYVDPHTSTSCDVERLNTLTFSFLNQHQHQTTDRFSRRNQLLGEHAILMQLMLQDAILWLRDHEFLILSLYMRAENTELERLNNITIFAVNDRSMLAASHFCMKYHILPDVFLSFADLKMFRLGATLPTLETGASLLVTTP